MYIHIVKSWDDLEIYQDTIVMYRHPDLFHDSYYVTTSSSFDYYGYVSPYIHQIDGEDGYVLNPVYKNGKLAHTITVVNSYIRTISPFLIRYASFEQIQKIDEAIRTNKAQLGFPIENEEWNRIIVKNLNQMKSVK